MKLRMLINSLIKNMFFLNAKVYNFNKLNLFYKSKSNKIFNGSLKEANQHTK